MLEHRVRGMKPFHGDRDQRLLGRLGLRRLSAIKRSPFDTAPYGIHGGEIQHMSSDARADRRQVWKGGPLTALTDHGIEADVGDERSSIGEAREAPELAEKRSRGMGPNTRKRLQERGIGRTAARLGRRQQGLYGLVELADRRGEALVLRQ